MDRTRGDLLVLAAQASEQVVRLEMLVAGEELVIKGLPLGRQLQATAFEVFAEDLAFSKTHAIATQSQLRYSLVSPGVCQVPGQEVVAAMWQGFTIALREGIEMFLIVALILAYLRRTG